MYQDKTLSPQYIEYVNRFSLLTRAEERELIAILGRVKKGKQRTEARERLINCNLRLSLKYAHYYHCHSSVPIEDLVSASNEGLIRAVDRFNPKRRNIKFSTFAIYWIKQSLLLAIYRDGDNVHVPIHIVINKRKFRKIMEQEHINTNAVMERMNINENGLERIMQARTPVVSMESNCFEHGDNPLELKTIIKDPKIEMSCDIAAQRDRSRILTESIERLTPTERDLILSRFYSDKKEDYRSVGRRYKITGEAIRQKTGLALVNLKRVLKKKTTLATDAELKKALLY